MIVRKEMRRGWNDDGRHLVEMSDYMGMGWDHVPTRSLLQTLCELETTLPVGRCEGLSFIRFLPS